MAYYTQKDKNTSWPESHKQQTEWTLEKLFSHPLVTTGKALVTEIEKLEPVADPGWYDQASRAARSILLNFAEYIAKGTKSGIWQHTLSHAESLETLMAVELSPDAEFKKTARPLAIKMVKLLREECEKQYNALTKTSAEEFDHAIKAKSALGL